MRIRHSLVSSSVLIDTWCLQILRQTLNQDDSSEEISAPALEFVHSVGLQLTC